MYLKMPYFNIYIVYYYTKAILFLIFKIKEIWRLHFVGIFKKKKRIAAAKI